MSKSIVGKKVEITHTEHDGVTGRIIKEYDECCKVKLDTSIQGCEYCIVRKEELIVIEENVQIRHVTIATEKLKELIIENYKWDNYTLQGKINIVTSLAYFENDKELLEFLEYMEED